MPRISLRQLRQAYKVSPFLSRLLPACRDLASAQNELRWLRDHHAAAPASRRRPLAALCEERRRGVPSSTSWAPSPLATSTSGAARACDVLVSNPPYVSSQAWSLAQEGLSYSTRKYEPKLALVPGDHVDVPRGGWLHEDAFYAALLDIALIVQPSIVLFEFGGDVQENGFYG
ncbi:unnamed protein product [Parascedosporium putredinis]|uniref:Uncharacterized protein n=1 Tax=Parascedosporium putredinis TaxID=1442378 RepID=A0A9P1GUW8_9PEZI|nr:unnamed protein product [Parascedosporium putredinis]CAI7987479.1 unnamed protein product [Parascedosporium putredinis]